MRWEDWRWPGNVRELKNAVARRIALGDLAVDAGPSSTRPPAEPSERLPGRDPVAGILALDLPLAEARHKLLVEFERRYAEHVLSQHGGNVTRAAAAAGVARRHFYRLKGR
jgi:DNA-binding NtrC family response regulator